MTPVKLAFKLDILADEMEEMSGILRYYGGFSSWSEEADKLEAAAPYIRDWGIKMLEQYLEAQKNSK
jgi:hypothetical protein